MQALSPYSQEYEREARAVKFYLSVWETFEFQIFDQLYQIEVDCTVLKTGEHGDLEISPDDFTIKSIYVGLPQFGNPLKLDVQNLCEDHAILWVELENALDFAILKRASKSEKWSAL